MVTPRIPSPPASDTAAISSGFRIGIPADTMGCSMPKMSVTRVRIRSSESQSVERGLSPRLLDRAVDREVAARGRDGDAETGDDVEERHQGQEQERGGAGAGHDDELDQERDEHDHRQRMLDH